MIIRILSEGQYEVDGSRLKQIQALDEELMDAMVKHDQKTFHRVFEEIVNIVRSGTPLDSSQLVESDLILPAADISMKEAQKLFHDHPLA